MASAVSSPEPGTRARQDILRQAAQETTAHGVARTVGDRHWTVRLIWAAAFLAMIALLLKQLVEAVQKLQDKPVSTSVIPNHVRFEFPDIHICSYPMVSASYSATMGPEERNNATQLMDSIVQLLRAANVTSSEDINRLASFAFVGTASYRFLSRSFGMRMEQAVIGASIMPVTNNLKLYADITDLRHYKFLNCYTIRLNDTAALTVLNNVMGYLDLSLYADATYNETFRLNGGAIDARALGFASYEFLIGSGFRLFFTQRGRYPDDYSASVAVSPGFTHHVSLSMAKTTLSGDKGQCLSDAPPVQIYDQALGRPVDYEYSLGACYANSMYTAFKSMECYVSGFFPIPYEQRGLPSCNNLSAAIAAFNSSSPSVRATWIRKVSLMMQVYNGSMVDLMSTALSEMQTDCVSSKPCSELSYQPTVTSILFPLKLGLTTELINVFKKLTSDRAESGYHVPGRSWMVGLFEAAYSNGTKNSSAEAALAIAASENIVRVLIQATELTSVQLKQDLSYTFADLTAGVGGLMGLFMGGSVLTLAELIELIAFLIWGRRITGATAVKPVGSPEAATASGGAGHSVKTVF